MSFLERNNMIALFNNYIASFLHPFKNQEELRHLRDSALEHAGAAPLRLAHATELPTSHEIIERHTLGFVEVMGVSWFFIAIEAFYAVMALHFGNLFFQSWNSPQDLALLLPVDLSLYSHKAMLTAALAKVAFFPLIFWLWANAWKFLIRFFARLFQVEGDLYKMSEQIVNQSMTSHSMLAIPIFGRLLRHLSGFVHIFAGLRENMGMSVLQSVIVIVSPAVIMTMATSFFMVTVLYFISLLF